MRGGHISRSLGDAQYAYPLSRDQHSATSRGLNTAQFGGRVFVHAMHLPLH